MKTTNKLKDRLTKLFHDNKDADFSNLEFRNMFVDQIISIVNSTPQINKSGATVMTEQASAWDGKSGLGPRPKSV